MYIYKEHITDYIKCPKYFSINVLNLGNEDISNVSNKKVVECIDRASKSKSSKTLSTKIANKEMLWLKDHVSKIAVEEMKSGVKNTLYDYRIEYTNKFYKNLIMDESSCKAMINRLNNIFSVFSENVFIGYNVPVDIPISKTNIIYRDIIDFLLVDESGSVKAVEFDILELNNIRRRYTDHDYFKIPYAFLSSSMDANVNVSIIDPVNSIILNGDYSPSDFNVYYDNTAFLAKQVGNIHIIKNLDMCDTCEYNNFCN